MSTWAVRYWGSDGLRDKIVTANSRSSALELADVPTPRVVKVVRRRMLSRDQLAKLLLPRPSPKTQMLFLARVLALFATGNTGLVDQLITSLPQLRRAVKGNARVLRDDIELSGKLRHLGFNPEVTAIAIAGEKTGRPMQAIEIALTYMKQNMEIREKNSKQIIFGLLLLVVSSLMFFLLPPLLAEPLETLRNLRDVEIALTPATHVLWFVGAAVGEYGGLLCAVLALMGSLLWKFHHSLLRVPPFSVFGRLDGIRRSVRFLLVWRAFRLADIPLEEQRDTLIAALGPYASAHMFGRLRQGETLSDTLDDRFFSSTLTLAAAGLSQVGTDTFAKVVDALLVSLREEQQIASARAAGVLYALGVTLTAATIALLALGLIFPIMSASTVAF